MHPIQRLASIALLALLCGCASHAPGMPAHNSLPPPIRRSAIPSDAGEEVLVRAIGLVGTPYLWGGNTAKTGFDCSGLIVHVFRDAAGLHLPRTTREMSALRVPHVPRQQLRSGDLVFFATNGGRQVSHAGIYVGDGRFVHAPRTGSTVRLDKLDSNYWQRTYLGARRVIAAQ